MRQKRAAATGGGEQTIRDTRRATRRQYSAEEKIRIVLDGPARRGQHRRAVPAGRYQPEPLLPLVEGVPGAGKKRLAGDTAREATSEEVKGPRRQAGKLKEVNAELTLENRLLKKCMTGDGGDEG